MTAVVGPEEILSDHDRRLHDLEQTVTNPAVVGGGGDSEFPDGITIGEDPEHVVLSNVPPDTPINLIGTPGAFFNTIFVDLDWDPPVVTDPAKEVVDYEVEVAKKVDEIYQLAMMERTAPDTIRIEPLEPETTYGFRVYSINALGIRSTPTAWLDVTTTKDATVPPAVTGVTVGRGATSVVVTFDPSTEPDVVDGGLYEIQIDTTNDWLNPTGNFRKTRTTSWVVAFNDILAEGTWYARVSAIDSSGNQGPWAEAGPATAGGVIDSMVVAGLSAAKITFGQMSGDRIQANTLDVNAIKTSSLTSGDITLAGGQIKAGNPPTDGLLINSQGLRLYDGGVAKVILDNFGNATFQGNVSSSSITSSFISASTIDGGTITGATIRTASSGHRTEFTQANPGYLYFYTGDLSETNVGGIFHQVIGGTGSSRQSWIQIGPSRLDPLGNTNISLYGESPDNINKATAVLQADFGDQIWLNRAGHSHWYSDGSISINAYDSQKSSLSGEVFLKGSKVALISATGGVQIVGTLFCNAISASSSIESSSHVKAGNGVLYGGGGYLQWTGSSWLARGDFGSEPQFEAGTFRSTQSYTGSGTNIVISGGVFVRQSSSIRYKKNLKPMEDEFRKVLELDPSWFVFKKEFQNPDNIDTRRQLGLVAEEVEKVIPDAAIYEDDKIETVDYQMISMMMLGVVKDLDKRVETLERMTLR